MNPLTDIPVTDDALVYIFEYVAGFSESCDSPDCIDRAVALSHVSKRWRRIALVVPYIWTMLTSDRSHPDQVAEQLKRIGSLPLWVVCDTPETHRSLAMLASISRSDAQIQRAYITFDRRDLLVILKFLERPSPRMTRLTLLGTEHETVDQAGPQDPLDMIGERQLWASLPIHTPALRFLHMQCLPWIDAGPSPWRSLESLVVVAPDSYYSTDKLTLDDVLVRLSVLTHLKYLRLACAWMDTVLLDNELLQKEPGELSCPWRRVALPNLRELDLKMYTPGTAIDLGRCISVPPNCHIIFSFGSTDQELSPDLVVKHLLPHSAMRRPVDEFYYAITDGMQEIQFSGIKQPVDGNRLGQITEVQLACDGFDDDDYPRIAIRAWSLFDFAQLKELYIKIDYDPEDLHWWKQLFDPCARVEKLTMIGLAIPAFIHYCEDGVQKQPPLAVYPRLIKLECREIQTEDLRVLIKLLRWRHRAEYGPQKLHYTLANVLDRTDFLSEDEDEGEDEEDEELEEEELEDDPATCVPSSNIGEI